MATGARAESGGGSGGGLGGEEGGEEEAYEGGEESVGGEEELGYGSDDLKVLLDSELDEQLKVLAGERERHGGG